MGRAEILENKGEGKYRCQYKFDTETIARELQILDNEVIELNNGLVKLIDEIAALKVEFTAADTQLQIVLAEPGAMTPDRKKRLSEKLKVLNTVAINLKQAEAAKALSELRKEDILARSLTFSALPEFEERDLWMADYSAEIEPTGADIPTIEVAGEAHGENWALLYPAKNEAPLAYDRVMHGERCHAASISPAACFAAWAMLPGWQKYRPSYRVGKILEMKEDGFAKVELQVPLVSSEQNLPIPPSDPMVDNEVFERQTHERVPFEYMDCDAIAFKVGDEVLIKYKEQDSTQPVIIGFAHDPEPCTAINVYTSAKERLRYAPRKPGRWVSVKNPTVTRFGSCYWVGDSGAVSWVGWRARYFAANNGSDEFTSRSLYHKGLDFGPCPGIVLGGCVRKKHLFAVCRVGEAEVLYSCPLAGKHVWTEIARINASTWPSLAPWYFSQSGCKAASSKSVGNATQIVELTRPTDEEQPPFSAAIRARSPRPATETNNGVYGMPSAHLLYTLMEHSFAVDYVGESLVTLDRYREDILDFDENGYYVLFRADHTVIRCAALNVEFPHGRTETKTVVTYDLAFGQWSMFDDARTMFPVGILEHLNITGGEGHIVSVTRLVSGVRTTQTRVGLDAGIPLDTVTATQRMVIRSGEVGLSTPTVSASVSATIVDGFPVLTPGQQPLFALFHNQLLDPATTVATRTGHLVTSMPLVRLGRAMPPLPVNSPLRLVGGGPIGAG